MTRVARLASPWCLKSVAAVARARLMIRESEALGIGGGREAEGTDQVCRCVQTSTSGLWVLWRCAPALLSALNTQLVSDGAAGMGL